LAIVFNRKWNHFYARQRLGVLNNSDRINILLETGRDAFGMENGIVSRISDGLYTVEYSTLADWLNMQFPLYRTYCDITVKISDVLASNDMSYAPFALYREKNPLEIESYIGIPLWSNNNLYGTIAFTASEAKLEDFDERDKNFMRSIARHIQSILACD
jgi:GAF domain-containing protein